MPSANHVSAWWYAPRSSVPRRVTVAAAAYRAAFQLIWLATGGGPRQYGSRGHCSTRVTSRRTSRSDRPSVARARHAQASASATFGSIAACPDMLRDMLADQQTVCDAAFAVTGPRATGAL